MKGIRKAKAQGYYRSLGKIMQIASRENVHSDRFLIHK